MSTYEWIYYNMTSKLLNLAIWQRQQPRGSIPASFPQNSKSCSFPDYSIVKMCVAMFG